MRTVVLWLAVPVALAALIFWLKPEVFWSERNFQPSAVWSIVGVFLSYFGVVFSAYALVEVRRLSNRYFAKQRLPELKTQIEKIRSRMDELSQEKVADIRSEGFVGETRVVMKQLQKARSPGFSEVVKRAKEEAAIVEDVLKNDRGNGGLVNDIKAFWDLHRTLSEISDEIHAFSLASKASL
jgi:hypothetical protein